MRRIQSLTAFTLTTALLAGSAFAQAPVQTPAPAPAAHTAMGTTAPAAGTTAPATHSVGSAAATTPSERSPVLTDSGEVRASKVVGSAVYNDHNDKVGSVDDLLIGKDGKLAAVLSVGGFLGMGNKLVSVPYSELKFGNTTAGSANRVVLTGATKETVKAMPDYHFARS